MMATVVSNIISDLLKMHRNHNLRPSDLSSDLVLTMPVRDIVFYELLMKEILILYTSYTQTKSRDPFSQANWAQIPYLHFFCMRSGEGIERTHLCHSLTPLRKILNI